MLKSQCAFNSVCLHGTNTSDIIYSVNKFCQVEIFLKVCYADVKYLPYKL